VRACDLAERDVFRLGGPGSAELAVVSVAILRGELDKIHLHVVVVGGEAAEELALAGEREFNVDALRTVWRVG
jgi:hypothetical protein